jgi:hypothetical protein
MHFRTSGPRQDAEKVLTLIRHLIVTLVGGADITKVHLFRQLCGLREKVEKHNAPKWPLQCTAGRLYSDYLLCVFMLFRLVMNLL